MTDFFTSFSPAFILIAAGVLAAFVPMSSARKVLMIGAPFIALAAVVSIYFGADTNGFIGGKIQLMNIELTTIRL